MKHETNVYDQQPLGASKAKVIPLEPKPNKPTPTNLDEVGYGVIFTGIIRMDKSSFWKGTFLKNGGGVTSLSSPGEWFKENDRSMKLEDYQQVDIEVKVVPHVG